MKSDERHPSSLAKSERLSGRKTIDKLFNDSGSRSFSAFPLRVVYMRDVRKEGEPSAQMMVSVPKRLLRHAVKRNRVKRQVREAYRHNKHIVCRDNVEEKVIMAFIYLDRKLNDSGKVAASVKRLMERVNECLA